MKIGIEFLMMIVPAVGLALTWLVARDVVRFVRERVE